MANDEKTILENGKIDTESPEQDGAEGLSDDESIGGIVRTALGHNSLSNENMLLYPAKVEEELDRKFRVVSGATISGFIYFITNGKFVKIGSAENVLVRLAALQTSTPDTLKVLFTIPLLPEKKRGASYYSILEVEKYLHDIFKPFNYRGEWFDIHDVINVHAWRNYFGAIMTPGSASIQEYAIIRNRRETQKHIEKIKQPEDHSGYESIEKRITGLEYKLDALFIHLEKTICLCADNIKNTLESCFSHETEAPEAPPESNKKPEDPTKRMLSTDEAAEIVGLSPRELRNGFRRGIYRALQVGYGDRKKLRWNIALLREDIAKMLEKEDAG